MPPPIRTGSKNRSWSRPLADLVGPVIDPVLARQGFSESDLILYWDDIVGERLAANSRPIKLQWPPRPAGRRTDAPPQPATLVVRVEGAFALELQHMADQVLGRINAHLGWHCVGRLAFRQGPIERVERKGRRRSGPPQVALDEASARLTAQSGAIADEGLRQALVRLGAGIAQANGRSARAATPTTVVLP